VALTVAGVTANVTGGGVDAAVAQQRLDDAGVHTAL